MSYVLHQPVESFYNSFFFLRRPEHAIKIFVYNKRSHADLMQFIWLRTNITSLYLHGLMFN